MYGLFSLVIIIISLFFRIIGTIGFSQEPADTSFINNQNKRILSEARRNPDLSIYFAHHTLAESRKINYLKGMADASLVLGTAWLAKYNKGDSALFYNKEAYTLYNRINDTPGKARACYGLAYVYSIKGDLAESERYSTLSLGFFEKAGDKRGIINSYNALSYLAKQMKNIDKARSLIEKAIETARSVKDTLPLADALNSLGNIYKDMALFRQAIDTYFEALKLWELKGDSNGISIAYGSIGLMYFYQKEWDQALNFNFKKLPLSLAAGNLWEVSKTYNTIAQIFNSTGRYDSALIYLRKSLKLNLQMYYPSGIADSYHNIAAAYLLTSGIDSAFYYINKALALAKDIDEPSLVNYLITLGNVHRAKGNYTLALNNALAAYSKAKELRLPMVVYESSALLSDIYSHLNRKDLAFDYLQEHRQLSDSISNDEFLKRVTRLEIQYDFDKKQKEAEYARMEERILQENRMRQQKLYVNGLLILLFLLTLISFLYIRHNQLRARYTRIDLEQRLLRAQMNPHFIFNSLCAVQDFILAGYPQKANTFLTKIARLMRNILENSREEFIPLEKEIETVKLYLDLQQLRFETGFDYDIFLDDAIDPENFSIPPMLTQPCIENSIEHGLLPLKKEKGNLRIKFSLNNGLMRLEVTDNGIGRKEAAERAEEHKDKKSVSSKVTAERLENFRKTLRQKNISYNITDLYDKDRAAGTSVVMMLPYKKIYA
jgi:tetratricopeptide (TPR) repeat protein